MQKTAQRRGFFSKLRENTDISGRLTERYFNPEFKEIMDRLREMDDKIRATTIGAQHGNTPAPDDPVSMKSLVKSSKSNASKREYMKAVADLGRFHKKMLDIVNLLSAFKMNVDAAHEKFLFNDLDDDSKSHLQSFKDRWTPKTASFEYYFVKESGMLDFFTATEWGKALERNRALSSWEKRYPNKVKDLKNDTIAVIAASEKMLGVLLSSLQHMDRARSTRNPDNYINASNKIIEEFKKYDDGEKGFKKFYEKNVKGFLEKQEFFAPTKVDNSGAPKDLGDKSIDDAAKTVQKPGVAPTLIDVPNPMTKTEPGMPAFMLNPNVRPRTPNPTSIPGMPPIPSLRNPLQTGQEVDEVTGEILPYKYNPQTRLEVPGDHTVNIPMPTIPPPSFKPKERQEVSKPKMRIATHKDFYDSLEAMASESPVLLSLHIRRYAKSIWSSDPETSVKLFKIAQSIKE